MPTGKRTSPKRRLAALIDLKLSGLDRREARRTAKGMAADDPLLQAWMLKLESAPDVAPELRHRISDEDKAAMRNWRARGWTLRRIAEMYGVSYSTVAEACGERKKRS